MKRVVVTLERVGLDCPESLVCRAQQEGQEGEAGVGRGPLGPTRAQRSFFRCHVLSFGFPI